MSTDREIAEAVEGLAIFENRWLMINEWGCSHRKQTS